MFCVRRKREGKIRGSLSLSLSRHSTTPKEHDVVHVGATEGGRMTARPPASILGSLHVCEADGCECERKEGRKASSGAAGSVR